MIMSHPRRAAAVGAVGLVSYMIKPRPSGPARLVRMVANQAFRRQGDRGLLRLHVGVEGGTGARSMRRRSTRGLAPG